MTVAFTCVLVALLIPHVWVGVAKKGLVKSHQYDNSAPRLQFEALSGAEQRANWAQQNAYESLPGFIAAVIIASLANAEQATIDVLAVVHVIARFAYGICYIKDYPTARSAVWAIGFISVIGLFVAAY